MAMLSSMLSFSLNQLLHQFVKLERVQRPPMFNLQGAPHVYELINSEFSQFLADEFRKVDGCYPTLPVRQAGLSSILKPFFVIRIIGAVEVENIFSDQNEFVNAFGR